MLERCVRILEGQLDRHEIHPDGARNLVSAADAIGRKGSAQRARAWLDSQRSASVYDEDNLAASTDRQMLSVRD